MRGDRGSSKPADSFQDYTCQRGSNWRQPLGKDKLRIRGTFLLERIFDRLMPSSHLKFLTAFFRDIAWLWKCVKCVAEGGENGVRFCILASGRQIQIPPLKNRHHQV